MARMGRKALTLRILDLLSGSFDNAKDTFDAAYTSYSCRDVPMATLAMFFFKYPSMLAFDEEVRGKF